ncbi:MAG: sulfatase-like hydrolase/transferase [Alphaproteobacteria bacterium]|nr:sulfatase-like hydrolase/transferase [Alphaproteobacteria bacterium]
MQVIENLKKIKYNAVMGVAFAFMVLLPDYLYQAFLPNIHYLTDVLFIFVITVFGFFMSMTNLYVYILICVLFMGMQLIQLGHIAYFSRPINPLDIGKVFDEFSDVYNASISDLDDFWFVPFAAICPFLAMIIMRIMWRKRLYVSYIGLIAVVIFLGVKPERATRRGLHHFLPPETRYSMHNSINSFSFYLVRGFDHKSLEDIVPPDFYKSYTVEKLPESSDLVVLVMGESTSAAKMHLLNPEANPTTPQLDALAQNDDFIAATAVSAGVATHASLPLFFNMVKEPGNIRKLTSYTTNLFKLAKENGYTTYFYSAYDMKQTNLIGVPYIDNMATYESNRRKFGALKEDYLFDLFKQIDLKKGKHFVVLNFRSTHSPYEKCYEHHPEFNVFKPQDDSRYAEENAAYDNAVLYIDAVLAQIIRHIKSQKIPNAQFVFTSDHGEMLGIPDGKYGHNKLAAEVYAVPFILVGSPQLKNIDFKYISHNEISKIIARFLGYSVNNPNFTDDEFFVHGNNLFKDYEFIRLKRGENRTLKEYPLQTVSRYVEKKLKKGR